MPISVTVDDKLIEDARKLGEHETDEEAVAAALDMYIKRCNELEMVRHRNRLKILDLAGTIDYDPDYDYKAERGKRR